MAGAIGASLRCVGWKAGRREVNGKKDPLTSAGPNFSPGPWAASQEMLLEAAPSLRAGSVPGQRSERPGQGGRTQLCSQQWAALCSPPRPGHRLRLTLVLLPGTFLSERLCWSLGFGQAFWMGSFSRLSTSCVGMFNRKKAKKNTTFFFLKKDQGSETSKILNDCASVSLGPRMSAHISFGDRRPELKMRPCLSLFNFFGEKKKKN